MPSIGINLTVYIMGFNENMQAIGDAVVERIDWAVGGIFNALVEKLDGMTENLRNAAAKGLSNTQHVIMDKTSGLSDKLTAPQHSTPRSQVQPVVEKTPEIHVDVKASAMSAVQAMGDKWPPQDAVVVANVEEASKSAMMTTKSQALVQTQSQAMGV